MDVKEILDEGMDEPMTWEVGEESGVYPAGTDDNEIGASELVLLKSIEKVTDTEFKCIAGIKNQENSEFTFTVSKGAKVELAVITAVDCMLGYSIEDCLCEITDVSENSLEFKIIGINR